jgi:hypothetical protein
MTARLFNPARPAFWIVLAIVLAAVLARESTRLFPDQLGYDMYHPWGISIVKGEFPAPANPYNHTRDYAAAMRAVANAGTSVKGWMAANFWEVRTPAHIEPTATPLYYALLAPLPRDYDSAHLVVALLQFACTAAAIVLLLRLGRVPLMPALCAALFVELTYNPFIQDVKMANANSFQLAAIAVFIWVSASGMLERRRAIDALYLPALTYLVVAKPNILWIAAALAAHYAVRRGVPATLRGSALSIVSAVAGFALGAWYFGSFGAWSDWLGYVNGHGGTLLYSLDGGNQSVAMLLAEHTGGYSAYTYGIILLAALGVALAVVLSHKGERPELLVPSALRALRDPWLAASVAVVVTCASSPLVWPHYFLLNLVPIGWLLTRPGRIDWLKACALLSFATQWKPLIVFLGYFQATGVISSMMAFTWAPLLPAILASLAQVRDEVAASTPARATVAA